MIAGVLGVLLFVHAGRLDWIDARLFIAAYGAVLLVYGIRGALRDPEQLRERAEAGDQHEAMGPDDSLAVFHPAARALSGLRTGCHAVPGMLSATWGEKNGMGRHGAARDADSAGHGGEHIRLAHGADPGRPRADVYERRAMPVCPVSDVPGDHPALPPRAAGAGIGVGISPGHAEFARRTRFRLLPGFW